ncbi:maleylpyruvate isomerase N-terminal domain-containing protein [Streptomyces fragilis]|uniref:Maleylpyruvate isomerase N-terminal domain-containing protein n=1 Tax=Streptomyces fragilis TaxID=67301 RepID=A0ABV2YGS7_9ACTN|nr:maleylpyruvate isomerase N-terminal domain-containing protein [Streptomyces fragilis]
METRFLMTRAAAVAVDIVRGIGPDALDLPTPCPGMRTGVLVNHLIEFTGEPAQAAGRKQPPSARDDTVRGQRDDTVRDHTARDHTARARDLTAEPDRAEEFALQAAETAAVWSTPEAWTGETALAGTARMPARFIGGIVRGEWLLHGWDLAVATGQEAAVDEELAAALYEDIAGKADMARKYGVFGPEVAVAPTAPLFHRALGLAGRDPAWRRPAGRR